MKPSKQSILIVDDEEAMREGLAECLDAEGYDTCVCAGVDAAQARLSDRAFDLVITDLAMEPRDGMELLEWVRNEHASTPVIMITGFSTVANAVEAMRKGAADYIPKPFKLDEVRMVVSRVLHAAKLERDNRRLRQQLQSIQPSHHIVGRAAVMLAVINEAQRIAKSDLPVLITGETGTGKELLAREVHAHSNRVDEPLLMVNCGALPDTLLESELFGHSRGAFTGAATDREGLFEAADGGTLFLDEIGDISGVAQARLLRVLQDGEIRRLGQNISRRVDVRIIAATNQDIQALIRKKTFREDLYFRINAVELCMPPLRNRTEDIPLLAEHFLRRSLEGRDDVRCEIDEDAMKRLTSYAWPGNVRELENVIKRAAVLCDGDIVTVDDLPVDIAVARTSAVAADGTLESAESKHIAEVLHTTGGNISRAARMLNISRPTLRAKIEKYGIDNDRLRKS